jgi:hypothetical protein
MHQEAARNLTFGTPLSALLKNYIFRILADWYMHGTDPRRGGVVGG